MRGYAAYRHFCLYLHKRMRTKINYKGSVTQDMESVNEKKLYIVCEKIKKFSNLAELSDFQPVLLLYRSFEKRCHERTLTISQHGTGSYTGAWDRSAIKSLPLLDRCTARPGNTWRELRRRKWPRVSCGNKNWFFSATIDRRRSLNCLKKGSW